MTRRRPTRPRRLAVVTDDRMDDEWCQLDYAEQVVVVLVGGLGMVPPRFREDFVDLAEDAGGCRFCTAERYGGAAAAALLMMVDGG